MAVHPIEERYGTAEMRAVWSEKNRFSCIVSRRSCAGKGRSSTRHDPGSSGS